MSCAVRCCNRSLGWSSVSVKLRSCGSLLCGMLLHRSQVFVREKHLRSCACVHMRFSWALCLRALNYFSCESYASCMSLMVLSLVPQKRVSYESYVLYKLFWFVCVVTVPYRGSQTMFLCSVYTIAFGSQSSLWCPRSNVLPHCARTHKLRCVFFFLQVTTGDMWHSSTFLHILLKTLMLSAHVLMHRS